MSAPLAHAIIFPPTKQLKVVIPANAGTGLHTIDRDKMIEHKRAPFPGILAPEVSEAHPHQCMSREGRSVLLYPLLCIGDSVRVKELFPDEFVIANQGLPSL